MQVSRPLRLIATLCACIVLVALSLLELLKLHLLIANRRLKQHTEGRGTGVAMLNASRMSLQLKDTFGIHSSKLIGFDSWLSQIEARLANAGGGTLGYTADQFRTIADGGKKPNRTEVVASWQAPINARTIKEKRLATTTNQQEVKVDELSIDNWNRATKGQLNVIATAHSDLRQTEHAVRKSESRSSMSRKAAVVVDLVQRTANLSYGPGLSMVNPPVPLRDDVSHLTDARSHTCDGSPWPAGYVEGGHGLSEFTLLIAVKSTTGCVEEGWHKRWGGAYVDYEDNNTEPAPWLLRGCSLFNAVYALWPAPTWRKEWRRRRLCCPVSPDDELVPKAGMTSEALASRAHVKNAQFHGARSDFGLSLAPSGQSLFFGVGHRDFAYRVRNGRPVRDLTLEAPARIVDGAWHTIAAVRRARSTADSLKLHVDDYQDETLELFVDGKKLTEAAIIRSSPQVDKFHRDAAAAAAASCVARLPATRAASCIGTTPHELDDAAHSVALGQLFRGCLHGARIRRTALDAAKIAAWDAATRAALPPDCSTIKPTAPLRLDAAHSKLPMYYFAYADNGSRAMRDAFVDSLAKVDPDIEFREMRLHSDLPDEQVARYGPKGQLIQRALDETPANDIFLVADLDIRFFKPITPIIRAYAAAREADAVFQRDEDWSLSTNLGFIALRSNRRVRDFFGIVSQMALNYSQGHPAIINSAARKKTTIRGGDQRIVNIAIRDPTRIPQLPTLRWALFPADILTRSVAQQRGQLYSNEAINVLFHVNDFGSNAVSPDKARQTKLALLDAAETRVRRARLKIASAV